MAERRKRPFTCSVKRDGQRWRVHCTIDGKQHRPRFSTKKEADAERKRLMDLHGNVGRGSAVLLANKQDEAAQALRLLSPHGASLIDAAKFYEERYLKFRSDRTFNEYFEDLIQGREDAKRSPRTVESLRDRTKAFLADHGDSVPRDMSPIKFVEWFRATSKSRNWSEWTLDGTKRKLSQLFLYIIKRSGMDTNPCEMLELPDIPETEVEIYTVVEAVKLLHCSVLCDLQLYFALGFFAGCRPDREARFLQRRDLYFDTNTLWVPERLGKTASRPLPMQPVLKSWFDVHLPNIAETDQIIDTTNMRKRIDHVFKAAGVVKRRDALRHSFGSYRYIQTGNKQETIELMGHVNDDRVFDHHYKRLVTKDKADAFWKLTPQVVEHLMYEHVHLEAGMYKEFVKARKNAPKEIDRAFLKVWDGDDIPF